ncbi:hypothetical protein, partial [Saccharibacillus sacchari]
LLKKVGSCQRHVAMKSHSLLWRILKLTEVNLYLPFQPLLRHIFLTCPGTTVEKFLVTNKNSAKSVSIEV